MQDLILNSVLVVLLVTILVQDLKYRAINWIIIALMAITAIYKGTQDLGSAEWLMNTLVNSLFIAFQLIAVTLYFTLKHKKIVNVVDKYLGLGDILLLFILGMLISPLNFIAFYVISLILMVVGGLMLNKKLEKRGIPMAGVLAAFCVVLISVPYFTSSWSLTNDWWAYSLF